MVVVCGCQGECTRTESQLLGVRYTHKNLMQIQTLDKSSTVVQRHSKRTALSIVWSCFFPMASPIKEANVHPDN